MQRFLNQLVPFILIGIAAVAFVFGVVLLAYLFLLGAIVGMVLFIATVIRNKFFPSKTLTKTPKRPGRTFDSDDWNRS